MKISAILTLSFFLTFASYAGLNPVLQQIYTTGTLAQADSHVSGIAGGNPNAITNFNTAPVTLLTNLNVGGNLLASNGFSVGTAAQFAVLPNGTFSFDNGTAGSDGSGDLNGISYNGTGNASISAFNGNGKGLFAVQAAVSTNVVSGISLTNATAVGMTVTGTGGNVITNNGSGASLTALNASQLTSGTVGYNVLPQYANTNGSTIIYTNTAGVTLTGGQFTGSGGGLTALPAGQLTGTVPSGALTIGTNLLVLVVYTNTTTYLFTTNASGLVTEFLGTNNFGGSGGASVSNYVALAAGTFTTTNGVNLGQWQFITNGQSGASSSLSITNVGNAVSCVISNGYLIAPTIQVGLGGPNFTASGTVITTTATQIKGTGAVTWGTSSQAQTLNGAGLNLNGNGSIIAINAALAQVQILGEGQLLCPTNISNAFAITNDPTPGAWNVGPGTRFTVTVPETVTMSATVPTACNIIVSNADWTTAGITKPQFSTFGTTFSAGLTGVITNYVQTALVSPNSLWTATNGTGVAAVNGTLVDKQ